MTALIAILLACYNVLQVSAALLPPRDTKFTSENFKHILTWKDPNNESPIYYYVECSRMYHPYETVRDCSNLTARRCDLTKHLTEITKHYRVRVVSFTDRDASKPSTTVSLTPVQETVLGPPVVDIVPCDRCIKVSIRPPVSHLWNSKRQRYESLFDAYALLNYNIQLMHMADKVSSSDRNISTENYTFFQPNLLPNANYCVTVTITSSPNTKPSIQSEPKCVITEYHVTGGSTVIIVAVVCLVLLLIGLVLCFFGLDRAGYICREKTLIPKVLKTIPTSESAFTDGRDFTSSTFSIPVDLISKKFEVEQKAQSEDEICEGGYESRKRLQEKDTSGTAATSGECPSGVSSSVGSSGQTNSSAQEDLSPGHRGDGVSSAVSELGSSSMVHLAVRATEDSSNLPISTGGVFNINLNSVSIAEPAHVWTPCTQAEAPREEAEDLVESHEAGIALDQHNDICLAVDDPEEQYCSDYEEEEEDMSENDDSDSHLLSGYMRR